MERIGEKCEYFTCDASYTDLCCGECYRCVFKGCRVCMHLDQCVAEHYWNEGVFERIVERLKEESYSCSPQFSKAIDRAIKIVKEEM